MARWFLAGIIAALIVSLSFFACAETVIRIFDAATGETEVVTLDMEEGFPEGSLALRIQGLQIISQRDARFAGTEYRYIRREPFERNGCGPASIHNAIAVLFSVDDADTSNAVLREVMTLLADSHNPSVYPINYQRVVNKLAGVQAETYPTLGALFGQAGRVVGVGNATARKVLAQVADAPDSALIVGRLSLNTRMRELVSIAEGLCEGGHGSALIAVANAATGDWDSRTPFCMGDNGHYITFVIQAQEFIDTGTVYILDSFPRAIRGESVNDLYSSKYYFADNNILTPFRVNYDVTRISPTALMCTLRDEAASEIGSLREAAEGGNARAATALLNARTRYASYIKTFGTGTLFVRIMDEAP